MAWVEVEPADEAAASPQVWVADEAPVSPQAGSPDGAAVLPLDAPPASLPAGPPDVAAAQAGSHGDSQVVPRESLCAPEPGSQVVLRDSCAAHWAQVCLAGSLDDAHSAAWLWDVSPDVLRAASRDEFQAARQAVSQAVLLGEFQAVRPDVLPVVLQVGSCDSSLPAFPPACSLASPQWARCVRERPAGNPQHLWLAAAAPREEVLRGSPWHSFSAHFLPS